MYDPATRHEMGMGSLSDIWALIKDGKTPPALKAILYVVLGFAVVGVIAWSLGLTGDAVTKWAAIFHPQAQASPAMTTPPPVVVTGNSGGQNGVITNSAPVYNGPTTINPPPKQPKAAKSTPTSTGPCTINGGANVNVTLSCPVITIAPTDGHTIHVDAGKMYQVAEQPRATIEVQGDVASGTSVALPPNPNDGDEVSVTRQSKSSTVVVSGNGKTIAGGAIQAAIWTMNFNGEEYTFRFEGSHWLVK